MLCDLVSVNAGAGRSTGDRYGVKVWVGFSLEVRDVGQVVLLVEMLFFKAFYVACYLEGFAIAW